MGLSLNHTFPDFEYEKMPTEVIRAVAAFAIKAAGNDGFKSLLNDYKKNNLVKVIYDIDPRILCYIRLNNQQYSGNHWWMDNYEDDAEMAKCFLKVVFQSASQGESLNFLPSGNFSWKVRTNPEIFDILLNSHDRKSYTLSNCWDDIDCIKMSDWWKKDKIRCAKSIGICRTWHRLFESDLSVEEKAICIEVSVGFAHLRPDFFTLECLEFSYRSIKRSMPNQIGLFDKLVQSLVTMMSSGSLNHTMDRAVHVQGFGGQARRRATEGWFREYMRELYGRSPEMAICLVRMMPHLFVTLPSELRLKREFRVIGKMAKLAKEI